MRLAAETRSVVRLVPEDYLVIAHQAHNGGCSLFLTQAKLQYVASTDNTNGIDGAVFGTKSLYTMPQC